MTSYVRSFHEIDQTQVALVGGKGAHLGELARIDGIVVPPGFVVTTHAFRRLVAAAPSIDEQLDRLSGLAPDDGEAVAVRSAELRSTLEATAVPDDVAAALGRALDRLGERTSCAVRSSATAEDLPTASFAGQQDSYLNVVGPAAILRHIRRCWASLFTERAVIYRLRNGFDHRAVRMAVVVQQMVFPHAAGILFTADPVTSHRKLASVEASFGLGEAVVAGRVNPDVYRVRDGAIVTRTIGTKQVAVRASPAGGTRDEPIAPELQTRAALRDDEVVRLVELGRRIEAHFGHPQDIEWCLVEDRFQFVQSRPITTLFPLPAVDDGENHVYVSVGHQQMMTDAMKPLGLSLFQLIAGRSMHDAGGRLFVDVARDLGSPARRATILAMLGRSDPLIGDALQTIVARDGFLPAIPDEQAEPWALDRGAATPIATDPDIVAGLVARSEASLAALKRDIQGKSGPELIDFLLADLPERRRILSDPQNLQAIMAGIEATWWLNDHLAAWLGEKNAADTLAQSAPNNITSEMGLALLDVADAIRPHPEVVAFLERVDHERFLDELLEIPGGREARDAIQAFLDRYGMRCAGEIDITRPRWIERPTTLVPAILGNVRNFERGAATRRFERGWQAAWKKEQELLERVRGLPDGVDKAAEVKRMIDRLRTFIGYREYPKYAIVSRHLVYKRALLEEATRLVRAGVLRDPEDIFYLTLPELHDVVRTHRVDHALIRRREAAFRSYQALTPPRVFTSEGEVITAAYRREVPPGALVGLPVSAGTAEGRARVVVDMAQADLEPGDILVTPYTDPSWTPLFVAIQGLVTEVGGVMTHGAVIAREYGLPAVVGVEHATQRIRDGQRIRVHGTEGYVEILDEDGGADYGFARNGSTVAARAGEATMS